MKMFVSYLPMSQSSHHLFLPHLLLLKTFLSARNSHGFSVAFYWKCLSTLCVVIVMKAYSKTCFWSSLPSSDMLPSKCLYLFTIQPPLAIGRSLCQISCAWGRVLPELCFIWSIPPVTYLHRAHESSGLKPSCLFPTHCLFTKPFHLDGGIDLVSERKQWKHHYWSLLKQD